MTTTTVYRRTIVAAGLALAAGAVAGRRSAVVSSAVAASATVLALEALSSRHAAPVADVWTAGYRAGLAASDEQHRDER